ncbi:MAG TPA: energy transducer TonB [Vicinamibacterales bacterium]
MLHLDELSPLTPRLPRRRIKLSQLAASAALHATVIAAAGLITATGSPRIAPVPAAAVAEPQVHLVFVAPELPRIDEGGGGGGGGQRQPAPISRAQAVGSDAVTLRTRKTPPPPAPTSATSHVIEDAPLPAAMLDAKPLSSGMFDQVGLPNGAMVSPSAGPGSGGGVGAGTGTGLGSGRGPGFGPGSGGGTGGGVYRAGSGVSSPVLIKQVRPRYTPDALRDKIQGTVVMEVIVKSDGRPSDIRVVRSLDPGLDAEAIATVAQWRFEPGRLAGQPVDVLVTVLLDFLIR